MANDRYPSPHTEMPARVAWEQPAYGSLWTPTGPVVVWATRTLEAEHGSADLGNKADPIEELVWIPLTRQTHRLNSVRCWQRIVDLGGPQALLDIAEDKLADLLKDGGFSRQKARWIKRSLELIVERFERLSLEGTATWTDDEVERFLTTLPGIAIKSAKCVMMYSLGRQVLPVDTHLRRLCERLGWVPEGLTERRIHEALEVLVPRELRLSLHVNAIWHGRSVCRALRPRCSECALLRGCRYGIKKA
jgi:endonuclease III